MKNVFGGEMPDPQKNVPKPQQPQHPPEKYVPGDPHYDPPEPTPPIKPEEDEPHKSA
jgi:hypothetical protein